MVEVFYMKKLCVFLLAVSLMTPSYINVSRDKLNYEILSIDMNNNYVVIKGWALMPHMQHFESSASHQYQIELKTSQETLYYNGNLNNVSMTKQMEYRGYPVCGNAVYQSSSCNYRFENVGFTFNIPISELKPDQDYELYLHMYAKNTKKHYRIPLFYVQNGDKVMKQGDMTYSIFSDYKHLRFSIFASTLISRTGPSPLTEPLYMGNSCSTSFGNMTFLKENAIFGDVHDIALYNGLISYFKVQVTTAGCVNNRQRLIESTSSKRFIYVPSTHVNYLGNPTILYTRLDKYAPTLVVDAVTLYQFEDYIPLKYANATDYQDGNLTHKIKVISSTVNMQVPGNYTTCYSVTNSFGLSTQKCGSVTVLKMPTRKRFISKYTIHDTRLLLWNRSILNTFLFDQNYLLYREINFD